MSVPAQGGRLDPVVTLDDSVATDYEYVDESGVVRRAGVVARQWVTMQYPLAEGDEGESGIIRTRGRVYVGEQFGDGSGIIRSKRGTAVYALRDARGNVLYNESRFEKSIENELSELADDYVAAPLTFVAGVIEQATDHEHPQEFANEVVGIDILEDDTEEGVLLTHESGTQVYVGKDSTAHGDGVFGFVPFDGEEGVPTPTARDALDLLTEAVAFDGVKRQGEWFLIPAKSDPAGSVQKPGVASRPYGGSPLESHIPRDWATGVEDEMFMQRVRDTLNDLPADAETPQDVFDWLSETATTRWDYEAIRNLADGIYVRGSLRHERNEHRMETVDGWHRAVTHDWEVFTPDDTGIRVRAD